MKSKIHLLKPHISGRERQYVEESFSDNWITTSGKNIDFFEQDIEAFLGNEREVLCVNSGTSALHLALMLVGVEEEDVVICQSFSFCASVNPIKYLGAKPVFIDSEPETWNMSPKYLEEAIKDHLDKEIKPKAIIITDSYGMPAKWDELKMIASAYEIPIIEDAAEALGSYYKDKACGLFGDYAIYSFNGNKIVTTSSGGALITRLKEEKSKALYLASQAKNEGVSYKHDEIGYNYRMSNVLAGIGRAQLEDIDEKVVLKREINQFYYSILKDNSSFMLQQEPSNNYRSNYWLNCIIANSDSTQELEKLKELLVDENIEYRELWYPLHLQKQYKKYAFYGEGFCEKIYQKGIALPSSTSMSEEEKERTKTVFKKVYNR